MTKYSNKSSEYIESAMDRMEKGTLKSGGKEKVINPKQAIAIGLSEARGKGVKVPAKKPATKKTIAKESSAKKTALKKASAKKKTTKKSVSKKATAKKTTAQKSVSKKTGIKK